MSLIIDMEMPKDCLSCPLLRSDEGDYCSFQSEAANEKFKDWDDMRRECPLRSTVDVVEIVQCKDCIHRIPLKHLKEVTGIEAYKCFVYANVHQPDFFCADGKPGEARKR